MSNPENDKNNFKNSLKEYYNYKYWREIQRNQLNNTSNIIFTFSIAIIGFTINFLLNNNTCSKIANLLFLSVGIYSTSICFYFFMNIIKLIDYRKTAALIKSNIDLYEIGKRTHILGQIIWFLFILEIIFSIVGLIISVISFKILLVK